MSEAKGEYDAGERPIAIAEIQHCEHCKAAIGNRVIFAGRKMVDLGTVLVDWAPRMVCKTCLGKIHYSAADCLIRVS